MQSFICLYYASYDAKKNCLLHIAFIKKVWKYTILILHDFSTCLTDSIFYLLTKIK